MDAEQQLKDIVKDTGEVASVYGGFEIEVSEPTLFPWHQVFNHLFEIGQEVWLNKREGKIFITSEPKIS